MIIVITQNPDGSYACVAEGAPPARIRDALTVVRNQVDTQFPELADGASEKPAATVPPKPRLYLPNGGVTGGQQ